MNYQWDPGKERSNRRKHGVAFADAVSVLEDERAITLEDHHLQEERYVTIGMDAIGQILVVVYTWRQDSIRMISARRATPTERKEYETWK